MNECFLFLIYGTWNFLMFINLSQTFESDANVNFTLLKFNLLWLSSFYCVGVLEKDVTVGPSRVSQQKQ